MQKYERWRNGRCKGDQQKAHRLRRAAFSAYLFQIIGNKHVLLSCIQHPICSAAQPADATRRFIDAWEQEKSSPDHQKRMQISERLTEERRSLKRKATKDEEKGDNEDEGPPPPGSQLAGRRWRKKHKPTPCVERARALQFFKQSSLIPYHPLHP